MDGAAKRQDLIMAACKGSEKDHALVEKLLADGHDPNKPEGDSGTCFLWSLWIFFFTVDPVL
jgi:hypothetical protein